MDVLRYLLVCRDELKPSFTPAPPAPSSTKEEAIPTVHSIKKYVDRPLTVEPLAKRLKGPRPVAVYTPGMSRAVFEAYRLFQGPVNLARAIGRNPSSVYRWGYGRPRFPGGAIPEDAYNDIIKAGEKHGCLRQALLVVEMATQEQQFKNLVPLRLNGKIVAPTKKPKRPVGRPRVHVFDKIKRPKPGRPPFTLEQRMAKDSANADERLAKLMAKAGY